MSQSPSNPPKDFDIEQFHKQVLEKIDYINDFYPDDTTLITVYIDDEPRLKLDKRFVLTYSGAIAVLGCTFWVISRRLQDTLIVLSLSLIFYYVLVLHLRISRLEKARQREKEAKENSFHLHIIREKLEDAEKVVTSKGFIRDDAFRRIVCPAIKSYSSRVNERAKYIAPNLITAYASKTIDLPLDPFIFATVAVVLSRSGALSICDGYSPTSK